MGPARAVFALDGAPFCHAEAPVPQFAQVRGRPRIDPCAVGEASRGGVRSVS